MRRYAAAALLLGTLSGCFNLDTGPETGGVRPLTAQGAGPPTVPGFQGPYGQPVPMAAPYSYNPPRDVFAAQDMLRHSIPMSQVQMNGPTMVPGMPPTAMPAGGIMTPPGMPAAPGVPGGGTVNPTSLQPMMPGPGSANAGGSSGDIMLAQFQLNPASAGVPPAGQRTQVRFTQPVGMQVSWYGVGPDGRPMYSPTPIDTPGKYNFLQGARYRLKLTHIPGRPGLELYPTLEVAVANHKAEAFLAHSNVPVEFTEEDFKQVAAGNYLVKVIYLPDPNFQDVAGTGTDEILSTRLEPGQDPIQEALRRGSVLLVIRMGNIDQEAPNTPPLSQPGAAVPPGAPGIPPGGPGMPPGLHGVPPGVPGVPPGIPGANQQFGPTMPGVLPSPVQQPYWGFPPPAGHAPPPQVPLGPPPGQLVPMAPVAPLAPIGPVGPPAPLGPPAPPAPPGPVAPPAPLGPVPPIGPPSLPHASSTTTPTSPAVVPASSTAGTQPAAPTQAAPGDSTATAAPALPAPAMPK
jgi:hypothetical protein